MNDEGRCVSCGKYLWDQQVYERAEEFRNEIEVLKLEVEWFRAALRSEREACAKSCDIVADEASEMFDKDGAAAAHMCGFLIRARGMI